MIEPLSQARTGLWVASVAFGILTMGLLVGSAGWFLVLANSPVIGLLPMVGFFFFETAVAAVATVSLLVQATALERLREHPAEEGTIRRLLLGHRLLWGALAAGGAALIFMICVFVPWHTPLFWRD